MKKTLNEWMASLAGLLLLVGGAGAADPPANRSTTTADRAGDAEFYEMFKALRSLADEAERQSNQQALISGNDALRNRNVPPDLAERITQQLDAIRSWARNRAIAVANAEVPEIDVSQFQLTEDQRRTLGELQPAFQSFNYTVHYYQTLLEQFNRAGARLVEEQGKNVDSKTRRAKQLELLKFVYDFRSFWTDECANYRGFEQFETLSKYKREAIQASDEFDEQQNEKLRALEEKLKNTTNETLKKIIQASIDARIKLGETVTGSVKVWRGIEATVAQQQAWIDSHMSRDRQEANTVILDLTADTYKALILAGDVNAQVSYDFYPEEIAPPINLTWDLELFRKVVKLDRLKLKP